MKIVEELTQAQKDRMPYYTDKWIDAATIHVKPEFYTPEIMDVIKNEVIFHYKEVGHTITKDKIHMSTSPIMSLYEIAAYEVGKKGKAKKYPKWKGDKKKITGMEAVETYLKQFENPYDIIDRANELKDDIYYNVYNCGFCGFVDFFLSETDIEFEDHTDVLRKYDSLRILTELTHTTLMFDEVCFIAPRPTIMRTNKGEAIDDGKPYMVWSDGIGVIK